MSDKIENNWPSQINLNDSFWHLWPSLYCLRFSLLYLGSGKVASLDISTFGAVPSAPTALRSLCSVPLGSVNFDTSN